MGRTEVPDLNTDYERAYGWKGKLSTRAKWRSGSSACGSVVENSLTPPTLSERRCFANNGLDPRTNPSDCNILQLDKATITEHTPPQVLGTPTPFLLPENLHIRSGFLLKAFRPLRPRKFDSSKEKSPMKLRIACVVVAFVSLVLSLTSVTVAQTSTQTASALPRLVRFGGTVKDLNGSPLTGVVGITFAFYSEKTGGAPLWLETQNATADSNGHYTVLLGSTKPEGLPADLFTSEQARWAGVQVSGQAEQPRVLLVSAPYALKAGDAETIGGLPPSAFMLAAPPIIGSAAPSSTTETVSPAAATDVTTTGGTLNYLPIFSGAATIIDSSVFQTGSGTTGKIGIDTTTPATQLDVNGAGTIRGTLSLPATGNATAAGGKNSQGLNLVGSSFSSTTGTAQSQVFRWLAEPAANDTTAPSGTLNLQYGLGTATPTETGLKLSSKGIFTFATGQTFPGTGDGSVKSVALTAPTTDFTVSGSPVTGTGTLNFAWKVAPTNADKDNAIVKRDATGSFNAGAITASLGVTGLSASTPGVTGSNSSGGYGVYGTSAAGAAILGQSSGTNAVADGVDGVTSSGGASGVAGINNSDVGVGVYGTGGTGTGGTGVFGTGNTGVYGISSTAAGVLGQGITSGYAIGVVATSDEGYAVVAKNNSIGPTVYMENDEQTDESGDILEAIAGFGNFNGACQITVTGSLFCNGSKSAVVPVDGGTRKVALYAVEAPENWFEDAGSGQLSNGEAVINLEAVFGQTVNTGIDYHIFLTPNGDCKGLYVAQKSATSFVVRELGGGASSIPFDYRIMAKRKGYETIRLADKTKDFDKNRFKRTRTGTPPPAPQRERHRLIVTPPVAQVSKPELNQK